MAGTLTFPIDDRLKSIVEHAATSPAQHLRYGEKDPAGLWLVKDQGVYLMSNGNPQQPDPNFTGKGTKLLVAYANECNPDTLPFDEWYEACRDIMGGDDCVECLRLDVFKDAIDAGLSEMVIQVTSRNITVRAR